MRDAAFAFTWLILLPMSFVSAHAGILLWIWVALLSPNEMLYGVMAGVPFNKLVAISTVLLLAVHREKKDYYVDLTVGLLFALFALATMSWLSAIVPSDDGTELYLKLTKELVLAGAITAVMNTRFRIHAVVLIVVFTIGFLSVREGLEFLGSGGGHKILGTGSIGDNNSFATAVLMVIPLLFYIYRYASVRVVRLGFMIALVLSVVTVVGTFSRGGFLGMVVLAAFLVKNSRNKFGTAMLVAVAAVLVYVLAPESWFQRLDTIGEAGADSSFMGRVVAWKMSLLIALAHPLTGGGPHAVQRLLVWDTYKPFLGSVDFVTTPPPDIFPHAAHSIWFEILGDLGFGGLFLFILILGIAFWNCRSIQRLARGHPGLAWAADLARMMQVSLVMYITTGSALSMGYFELVYIILAVVSRTRRTVMQTLKAESTGRVGVAALPSVLGAALPSTAFTGAGQVVQARR